MRLLMTKRQIKEMIAERVLVNDHIDDNGVQVYRVINCQYSGFLVMESRPATTREFIESIKKERNDVQERNPSVEKRSTSNETG